MSVGQDHRKQALRSGHKQTACARGRPLRDLGNAGLLKPPQIHVKENELTFTICCVQKHAYQISTVPIKEDLSDTCSKLQFRSGVGRMKKRERKGTR